MPATHNHHAGFEPAAAQSNVAIALDDELRELLCMPDSEWQHAEDVEASRVVLSSLLGARRPQRVIPSSVQGASSALPHHPESNTNHVSSRRNTCDVPQISITSPSGDALAPSSDGIYPALREAPPFTSAIDFGALDADHWQFSQWYGWLRNPANAATLVQFARERPWLRRRIAQTATIARTMGLDVSAFPVLDYEEAQRLSDTAQNPYTNGG